MTLEESYEILENYYQNIYGMYDDNWIDYDLDVAFTKLQLEKNHSKKYKLDHHEKMILQWCWKKTWNQRYVRLFG